ncbi:MAG: hypothetical protein EPN82_13235 [Bacteroidetes bacterium]|nr:MAG: hypothetical protein EPN82_13235 [Bacteroidota bacterium]
MKQLLKITTVVIYYLTFLLSHSSSFGQFSSDNDGSISVSPINGNLSYQYPISNYSIDGYSFNVSMNYSGNVVHTHFHKYVKDTADTNKDGWIKLTRTHPAWILGVNGFAIQVLGQKFSYISWYPGNGRGEIPDKQRYEGDDNVLWLIDGYDYCNRMHELKNPDDQDVIHLLKSDGSVLELRNPVQRKDVSTDNDPTLYSGHYYENEINSNGFAIVKFDSTYWPSYIKKFADGKSDRNSYIPRVIKYYPGDGLEYVFRETVAPYGTREFYPYRQIIYYPIDSNGITRLPDTIDVYVPGSALPTIFYLEDINSSMGRLTSFLRAYHYAKEDTVDVSRGRAPIIEFADHIINYGKDVLTIQSLGRTLKFNLARKMLNYNVGISCGDGCDEYSEYFDYGFGSEDNDNLTYERLYGDIFKLINNPIKEYETSYWDYFRFGEISLIKEIIDPENRKTEFKYGCKMTHDSAFVLPYGYSPCYFKLQEFRLDSIIGPTQYYSIEYHSGNGLVVQDEIINSDNNLDYDLISSVSQIKKYDYKNYQKGNLLETITYDFNDNTSGSDTIYKRITSVEILDNSDDPDGLMPQNNVYDGVDITYYLKQYKIDPLKPNETQSYYSPQLQMLYPAKITQSTYNNSSETIVEMDSIGSRFYFMPIRKEQKANVGDGWVTTSYEEYFYRDSIIRLFNDNSELQNAFGSGIVETKINILRPDNKVDTLYKIINSYLNLGHQERSISRTDSIWNRYESKVKTDSFRNLGIDTTVILYNTVQFHGNLDLPPIWSLPLTMKIMDGEDKLLIGKVNTYDTNFTSSGTPYRRRGSLINDSLIGKYNNEKLPINYYNYTGGWYQNFLSTITNVIGSKVRLYYDYHKTPASNYFYPKGVKLMNDNSTSLKKLYIEHKEIESPIATELYVRKYHPEGYIYFDTLTTFYEKTYYGLNGRIIEPNGWLYSSIYDYNGRAKKIWHPFDYPPEDNCTDNDPFEPGGRQIRIYSIESTKNVTTDTIFKYDTSSVRWEMSTIPYQSVLGEQYSSISPYYSGYGSEPTRVVSKAAIPVSWGSGTESVLIPDTSIVFHKDYVTVFRYIKDADDAIHNCNNLDSAYLRIQYIPQETDQYLILRVLTNKFGLEKRYVLDAPLIKLLDNVPTNPPTEGNGLPELKIDSHIYTIRHRLF